MNTPKTSLVHLTCMLWLFLAGNAFAATTYTIPEIGSERVKIIEQMGEPIGTITLRDKELLLFPQGEITLENGKATTIDLMTPAEFEADQKALAAERAEWEKAQAELAVQLEAQGTRIKAEKLSSLRFNRLPPHERAEYWRKFQNTYPDVDVSLELAEAIKEYKLELSEMRQRQQTVELEVRVAEAEQAAAEAKLETQKLRNELQTQRYYGLRYYTDPVIKREYYYRPPTITIHTSGDKTIEVRKDQKHSSPYRSVERTTRREGVREHLTQP